MMIGLFLGAGASYECGMPLVSEFTRTLRVNVLKRLDTKLFNFKDDRKLKETFVELLSNERLDYEQVVGKLEKHYLAQRNAGDTVHGVILQLIECIQILLLEDQEKTTALLSGKIKDYYGLLRLVENQGVIDVFSLNHDLVFEEICSYYKVPLRDGFHPAQDNSYNNICNFKQLTSDNIQNHNLCFHSKGERGVNLIKLHGSLDIFAAEDKKLYLKAFGSGDGVGSHIHAVRSIERHSLAVCSQGSVRGVNELFVNDAQGKLQFLRRSLLTGAHKFTDRFEQIAPVVLFDEFKSRIRRVDELHCIGYSFGDEHVNVVIAQWLSESNRTLCIYDPFRDSIPLGFESVASQVNIIKSGTTDYFLGWDSSNDSTMRRVTRKLLGKVRENLRIKRLESE